MARLSGSGAASLDPTAIDLSRLLVRLQQILLTPNKPVDKRLRTSSFERGKVRSNIEYARTLLLRLEQDAINIKVQSRKQETQIELLQKRDVIDRLVQKLKEVTDAAQDDIEDDSSEGEDLLGEDTPSGTDEHDTPPEQPSSPIVPTVSTQNYDPVPVMPERDQLFPSELRARHAQGEAPVDTAQTSSTDAATSAMTEKMMTHNRTEQENLTESLLSMAQALKASSKAFSNSLESEKEILGRAGDGLEKNTSGLEAAQKRMGYLRKMSEGKGWWGRMMLYAWIFGLMFAAFFIVAFMPKLRF